MTEHQGFDRAECASAAPCESEQQGNSPAVLNCAFSFKLPALLSIEDLIVLRRALDRLPEQVAVTDAAWNIICTNDKWEEAVSQAGRDRLKAGENYLSGAVHYASEGEEIAQVMLDGLHSMDQSDQTEFAMTYGVDLPSGRRSFKVTVSRFAGGSQTFAIVTRYDVTEVEMLRRKCCRQRDKLLKAQEEERRRIGRELHDSTAQLLAALQLDLMRLKEAVPDPIRRMFSDIDETVMRVQDELRATSFLFHPPSIADSSLKSSLERLLHGFGKRAGLHTRLIGAPAMGRSKSRRNVALYRVAQEALANIHRHARATRAEVLLEKRGNHLHLAISDDGIGAPNWVLEDMANADLGVGVTGMRERVRDLGGRLTIRRLAPGTCVIASVPLTDPPADKPRPVAVRANWLFERPQKGTHARQLKEGRSVEDVS